MGDKPFKQFTLPEAQEQTSNFFTEGANTFLKGAFQSPNYVPEKQGWKINEEGEAEFRKIKLGSEIFNLSGGQSISGTATELSAKGGGIINLGNGTYTLTEDITVPNSTKILGANRDTTILEMGSYQFIVSGTSIYTTGTISSIGSGGTAVVGSGTSWLANVTTSHQIFIDKRWYKIGAVVSDTSIILAEPYKDAATYSGTYRAAKVAKDMVLASMTIKSSSTTAIDIDDARDFRLEDILLLSNNKGFTADNVAFGLINLVTLTNSTSNGYELTNAQFFNSTNFASVGNGGHGGVWNGLKTCTFNGSAANGNTSDGINATDCDEIFVQIAMKGNGGQGFQGVSNVNLCNFDIIANANTSDGIKLTDTCDQNKITGIIQGNGGFGINIANANCDNNIILAPLLGGNSSGDVNDSGTGTIRIQASDVIALTDFGDGSDGALTISSGTTTIDLNNEPFIVKQYSSISITGTGKLAFSNPDTAGSCVILRVTGDVTMTSSVSPMIDISGLGQTGGTGGTSSSGFVAGTDASTTPLSIYDQLFSKANMTGGSASAGTTGATSKGTTPRFLYGTVTAALLKNLSKSIHFNGVVGAGGGGGSSGTDSGGTANPGNGGSGGKGGGSLLIVCGGALNITGTIDASGSVGSVGANGVAGNSNATGGGGGGGGGGGFIGILYTSLTADSGTYTVDGGAGGAGGNAATGGGSNLSGGGAAKGAASIINDGGGGGAGGGAGSNGTAGTAGSGTNGGAGGAGGIGAAGVGGGGGGGGGGEGFSFVSVI